MQNTVTEAYYIQEKQCPKKYQKGSIIPIDNAQCLHKKNKKKDDSKR